MNTFFICLILFVAIEHLYFLSLEMFLWTKPRTRKIFGIRTEALAHETKVLAANQGLYNGFIAAGLLITVYWQEPRTAMLFLSFVVVAGVYGAISTRKIALFIVQGLPALLAIIYNLLG